MFLTTERTYGEGFIMRAFVGCELLFFFPSEGDVRGILKWRLLPALEGGYWLIRHPGQEDEAPSCDSNTGIERRRMEEGGEGEGEKHRPSS